MASPRTTINESLEGPDTERVCVAPGSPVAGHPADEAAALLRRALDALDHVLVMLQALSPSEVEAEVGRVFLGRVRGDEASLHWHTYVKRHRVLTDLFATQHEALAQAARAHFARQARVGEGTREAQA